MGATDTNIEVQITANTAALAPGMNQAKAAVEQSVSGIQSVLGGMNTSFSGIQSIVQKVAGGFGMLGGVLAGGAMFKEVVSAAKDWNGEAMKMAAQLGITTEQASVLNVALGDIYSSSEAYLHSSQMMTRQLNSGGEGFKKLGVEIKDSNGHLRPTGELMQDVLGKLNGIEQGTARNAAGMAIFGRGWAEASKLLKLNAEVMEEAKKKAEALNLIVGGDAVEAQKAYKAAMNDVDDVMLGLKLTIGQQVLPILAEMGKSIAEYGIPVVKALSVAMKILIQALDVLVFGIKAWANMVGEAFGSVMDAGEKLASMFKNLLSGKWGAAADDARGAAQAIKNNFGAAFEGIAQDWEKLGEKAMKRWDGPESKETRVGKQGGNNYDPDKETKSSAFDKFSKEWEAQKALMISQGKEAEAYGKTAELAFWDGKVGSLKKGSEDWIKATLKANDLRTQLAQESLERDKARTADELTAAKENSAKRVEIAQKAYEGIRAQLGEQHKETISAHKRLEDEQHRHAEKLKEVDRLIAENVTESALAVLDIEEEGLSQQRSMGFISAQQQLQQLRDMEAQRLAIKRAGLQAEADLEPDPAKRQALNNQIEALERQHTLKMVQYNGQAASESVNQWKTVLNNMTSNWETGIQKILHGTMSLSQGIRGAFKQAGDYVEKLIIKTGLDWVKGEIVKNAATATGTTMRAGMEEGAALKSIALWAATAIKNIAVSAYQAAAGAYQALVGIPYVGPFLAPAAAGVALAAVLALGSRIASASGGYDIPSNVNPITQLHQEEMVLPAQHANTIRKMGEMIAQGGGTGGGSSNTYHISALDAKSFRQFLRKNQGPLGSTLGEMARNGRR